jgi:hypothetical protein
MTEICGNFIIWWHLFGAAILGSMLTIIFFIFLYLWIIEGLTKSNK